MIISISNFKGGVAKTSSAVNIGAGLARKGKSVLLIDIDPQYNLTTSLGVENISKSVYNFITESIEAPIIAIQDNLWLIPADINLNKAEIELVSAFKREEILSNKLQGIKDDYDYVIIDCPPSLGMLTINALVASDLIFVPIEAEYLALKGYSVLNESLDKIGLVLDKIFITKYDGRTILHRDIVNALQQAEPKKIFKTIIRKNVSIAEASANGIDIFSYDSKSNGAEDYESLVNEIINI